MVIYNKKMKIMKKLIFTTMAISALFLSVSCQKDNVNDAPKGEGVVFTAYVDGVDPDTKTVIGKNDEGKSISLWSGKERFWVLNGNNTWKKAYVATAAEPSEKVIFSEESSETPLKGNNYIAIYPASPADGSWWNSENGNYYVDKLWLTNSQTATAGSYDPSAHIALAHTTTNSLYFKNMVALLKFTAKSAKVNSIKVTVGAGEVLTGNFSCDPVREKIATDHNDYARYNYVELNGTFEAGKDYYIAVLPGTYSSLKLEVNGKVFNIKAGGAKFSRNKIYDMGEVDDYPVCEYAIVRGFNSWNLSDPYPLKDTDGDGIYEYKNLSITEDGFRFVKPGTKNGAFGAWKDKFYFDTDMESGAWYDVYTNNLGGQSHDILVSKTTLNWDIYIYCAQEADWGKEYKYIVVEAGSTTPSK